MKFIGCELGRTIVLFTPEQVRPSRGIPIGAAIAAIKSRYSFLVAPGDNKPIEINGTAGHIFENGVFKIGDEFAAITEFGLYNDGVSASAHDTKYTDAFIDDVIEWATQVFGLREISPAPRKLYRSQVIVEFSASASRAIKKFDGLAEIISAAYEEHTPYRGAVDITRLDFGLDSSQLPSAALKPLSFSVERRANVAFSNNRFFCEASLPTDVHLAVLEKIDAFLK